MNTTDAQRRGGDREIEPGVTLDDMTYDGQAPGPMVRVRQGDTGNLIFENPEDSNLPHNVGYDAVYGPGAARMRRLPRPAGSPRPTSTELWDGDVLRFRRNLMCERDASRLVNAKW